jgi:hypothetical protein
VTRRARQHFQECTLKLHENWMDLLKLEDLQLERFEIGTLLDFSHFFFRGVFSVITPDYRANLDQKIKFERKYNENSAVNLNLEEKKRSNNHAFFFLLFPKLDRQRKR